MSSALSLFALIAASLTMSAQPAPSEQALFWTPIDPPQARYEIDAEIDLTAGVLKGAETVRLANPGQRAIERLALDWSLTPASPVQIQVDGQPATIVGAKSAARLPSPLLIDLPKPLLPGQSVRLEIRFQQPFVYGANQIYRAVDDWHPSLRWDYPVHSEFVVRLRLPEGYRVAASGRFDPEAKAYRGSRLAAFGLAVTRQLQVLEAETEGVHIQALHTEKGSECARLLLDTAVDAVRFYRQRFGFYPHTSLVILPGGDYPAGGYPLTSAIVVVHGQERFADKPRDHWRWITAHEIGHQYWSEHVFSEGPDRLGWLMIGLGIYVDREYSKVRGLTARHREFLAEYAEAVRDGYDTTADRTSEQFRELGWDYNNKVIHAKGFSIISALESVIGPAAFDRAHARALREFAGRRLDWRSFERMSEQEAGQDLQWFFDQWVRSSRYPAYEITGQDIGRAGNRYAASVRVSQAGNLRMPVTVEAEFEDGSRQSRRTERMLGSQTLEFTSGSPLKQARLDPAGRLALVVPPPALGPDEISRRLRALGWSGAGEQAKELHAHARRIGIVRQSDWFRLGLLLYDAGSDPEALEAFRTSAALSWRAETLALQLVWQGHILDLLGRREEALTAYRQALDKWPAGAVQRHDQWGMRLDRKWIEDRLTQPFTRR